MLLLLSILVACSIIVTSLNVSQGDGELQRCLQKAKVKMIWRGSPDFDTARKVYNRIGEYTHPAVIVKPTVSRQISSIVRCAQSASRLVTVRSGGHSYGGFSAGMDDGVIIDMRHFNQVEMDVVRQSVVIGSGARLGQVQWDLAEYGFALPIGSCPMVGLVGQTLGGGQGLLTPLFGTLSDNVLEYQVVLANGTIVLANDHSHSDLFWALRGGGGGNFGVVIKVKMRMYRIGPISYRLFKFPLAVSPPLINCMAQFAVDADPRFGTSVNVTADGVSGILTFVGENKAMDMILENTLESCFPPFKGYATVTTTWMNAYFAMLQTKLTPYTSLEEIDHPPDDTEESHYAHIKSAIFKHHPHPPRGLGEVIKFFFHRVPKETKTTHGVLLEFLGGSVLRPAPNETAFWHRNASLQILFMALSDSPLQEIDMEWQRAFHDVIRSLAGDEAYVNLFDTEIVHAGSQYFGANFPKLKAIAQKYDPTHLFDFPFSFFRMEA